MIYAIVSETSCDFLCILLHLSPLAVTIRDEDIVTALPYAKGGRYFDAVALMPT